VIDCLRRLGTSRGGTLSRTPPDAVVFLARRRTEGSERTCRPGAIRSKRVVMTVIRIGEAPAIPLPDRMHVDVVVLPREDSQGTGSYDDSVLTLAKELRAVGTSADYQHEPEARQWIGERSVAAIALAFVLGIASNAGWDALKLLFSTRYARDRVKGKVARCTQTADQLTWEWFDVDGTGEEVARALGDVQPRDSATDDR
jgi:hypothetical protein